MSSLALVKYSTLTAGVVSLISLSSFTSTANAASIANGSFETGNFTGWSTIGNASVETAEFGTDPTKGTSQASLTTEFDTVSSSALESFLGLAPKSLSGLRNGKVVEGSAIQQTFTAKAGDVLTFDWNFLTNESSESSSTNNDFAFATLKPFLLELADASSASATSLTSFPDETGFQTFSTVISTPGTYTLGVGVANVGDTLFDSGLVVDNAKLTPVPEPSSVLGTLALGVLVTGSVLRRKQKQKASSKLNLQNDKS